MKVAAFFFDLDGTLVDTEAAWTNAIVDLVKSRGGDARFDYILENVVGRNWIDIDNWLHAQFPVLGDTTPMEDAVELRGYYERYATDPESMKIVSSIEFFKSAAQIAPCAIVSGSPHDDVVKAAELCGISDKVAFVLGAGDYARGKPDPSSYLRAAEIVGADPGDCVVIEDSSVGVAAGVAAGMKVIAIDRAVRVPQTFVGETWKVKDLSEFDMGVLSEFQSRF